ncbi:MAG: hypothetical protein FWH14_01690 [Oscillospiraceae bacterium]|nr:hypothetical protein [Oscillospiraceae bacterium]
MYNLVLQPRGPPSQSAITTDDRGDRPYKTTTPPLRRHPDGQLTMDS